jgi:hypothetical protein
MSDEPVLPPDHKSRLSKEWASSDAPKDYGDMLFKPAELDIYADKATDDIYIFHGKVVDYAAIKHAVYNSDDFSVTVVLKNGRKMDLGVLIQWVVRAYMARARDINFVRTQDGEAIDGTVIPLVHAKADA